MDNRWIPNGTSLGLNLIMALVRVTGRKLTCRDANTSLVAER